jgi:hypothetical protein
MDSYQFILSKKTYAAIENYQKQLLEGKLQMGYYLYKKLKGLELDQLSTTVFLEKLIQTKKPKIFAESEINGDGTDWNQQELSILGDIGVATSVKIFDNGRHHQPLVHPQAFEGLLLFTPGALLRGGIKQPADWAELVNANNRIDFQAYLGLYERRLLPLLLYTNQYAKEKGQKALVTIPGLGCGQFAGVFKGLLGELLKETLCAILERHAAALTHIAAFYYDPYNECQNQNYVIKGIPLLVRPLLDGNQGKSQLSEPSLLGDDEYDFSDCFLASFVAWDHVSWPGNDYYLGLRATDDGVKAAATDSMYKMTGVEGTYDATKFAYLAPAEYRNWNEVIIKHQLDLKIEDNIKIY